MPVTAFNSFTDGLAPNRRSREHFVTNINLEDGRRWFAHAARPVALIDRLTHHAEIISTDGESYRKRKPRRRGSGSRSRSRSGVHTALIGVGPDVRGFT